jgi:predicted nicotinamide N-methyase
LFIASHSPKGFDVILMADLLWNPDHFPLLLESIELLLAENGTTFLAFGEHAREPVGPIFLVMAQERFSVSKLFKAKALKPLELAGSPLSEKEERERTVELWEIKRQGRY